MNLEKNYKDVKVLVTGHTGFKGSWLVNMLLELGAVVAGYSLKPDSNPNHYILSVENQCINYFGDILEYEQLNLAISDFKPQIIFHLAAQPLVRMSYYKPIETYSVNVIGTLNLLKIASKSSSVKSIIIITTDKVYENKEWDFPYREIDELGGFDMYSSSKACCEIMVKSFRNSFLNINKYEVDHNILIATARAGNVIGGGDWSIDRLIPDVVRSANLNQVTNIRNKNSIRPWQHVLDCIYGYLLLGAKLINKEKIFAESWNFAPNSYETKSVKEVLEIARETWEDIRYKYIEEDILHEAKLLTLDNSKTTKKLNWSPLFSTKEAIENTINWYRMYYIEGQVNTTKEIKNYLNKIN